MVAEIPLGVNCEATVVTLKQSNTKHFSVGSRTFATKCSGNRSIVRLFYGILLNSDMSLRSVKSKTYAEKVVGVPPNTVAAYEIHTSWKSTEMTGTSHEVELP